LGKEYKELDKIVTEYKKLQGLLSNIDSAKKVLSAEKDPEFREMAKAELEELVPKREALEAVIKEMLIPKDKDDSKDIIMEIRGGTGGDEAALFAGDLFRMYQRFLSSRDGRWKLLTLQKELQADIKN
jgi:peptide chain release factor 1